MKKLIIMAILVLLSGFSAQSEIFTKKEVLDRFDDVLYYGPQKTIIVRDGSTISIEEKGKEKVVYTLDTLLSSRGTEERPVEFNGCYSSYVYRWFAVINGETCILTEGCTKKYGIVESKLVWILYPDGKRVYYRKY